MEQLNELVKAYLKTNGINIKHFSDRTGIEYSRCAGWLRGKRKLKPRQIKRVHDYLNNGIKSIESIMNKRG